MWKKFKWDMFVTSFIPLWLSIVVIDIWNVALFIIDNWDGKGKFVDNLMCVLCGSIIQLVSIAIIAILVLVSIIGINAFLNKKLSKDEKHLPKGTIKEQQKLTSYPLNFYSHTFCQ